mmetsp:Transcript_49395/g.60649  ORF Transcript_49395/g.60649 Transcript_49395/m.60649 type:complete len:322 (-) Transcript_49395:11-976(-)
MKAVGLAVLLGLTYAQQRECIYRDAGGSPFELNLTAIEGYRLEKEYPDFFYYYTPCRNGLSCQQGNANFANNVAQYKPGANQCVHYLAVDHHESPTYLFNGASWVFEYSDGEICDVTQEPRRVRVFYQCFEELPPYTAILANVEEPRPCEYVMEVRTSSACVPENRYNDQCRWRVSNGTAGGYYYLDLSSLNGTVLRGPEGRGYIEYFTPCQNGLHCYQQQGPRDVMGIIENRQTGTCEHWGADFESGRVQPSVHDVGTSTEHWSFHYWGGQPCSDGTDSFFDVRFFCNSTATTPFVLASYIEGDCRFFMNVSTSAACIQS